MKTRAISTTSSKLRVNAAAAGRKRFPIGEIGTLASALAMLFLFAVQSLAAPPIPVGVHRSDLAWLADGDPAAGEEVIKSIAQAGPAFLRLNVRERSQFEPVARHIRAAHNSRIPVFLELAAGTDPSVYPPGTERRPGREPHWPSFPISLVDPAAYETWIDDLFAVLKREDAVPEFVQTGNEFNWTANGDYPILPVGKGLVYSDEQWEKLPQAVRDGARKSGLVAAITARKMRALFPSGAGRPKVILCSLNKPADLAWLANVGGTFLLPEIFLQIAGGKLKGMPAGETADYLKELDGISLHFYPPAPRRPGPSLVSAFREYLRDFMEPVRKATHLPVYVSEFGFVRSQFDSERDRARVFDAFLKEMQSQNPRCNFAGVAVFSWDQMDYALVDPATGKMDPAVSKALGWPVR